MRYAADLSGNPLANEVNYRLFVIHTFPSLHVLDRHEITDDERIEARKMYTGMKVAKTCFGKTKPKWESAPKQEIMCLSVMTKDMYKEIEDYRMQFEKEQKAAQLAAAQTLSGPPTSTSMNVPVATAVETVTMNSKTLKDLLRDFVDEESDRTRKEQEGKKSGDFFAMKRFVSGTVGVRLFVARKHIRPKICQRVSMMMIQIVLGRAGKGEVR